RDGHVTGVQTCALPISDLAPDELTFETVDELIARGAGGPRVLGVDPATNLRVLALTGRYGPFVQLGEQVEGSKDKPKRASLFSRSEERRVGKECRWLWW